MTFLAGLVADGLLAPTNYDGAKTLFLEGQQPFWVAGPWELGTLNTHGYLILVYLGGAIGFNAF